MLTLDKKAAFKGRRGPVVLCIMDGVGYGKNAEADAIQQTYTPNLDWLHANCPATKLKAHGLAVQIERRIAALLAHFNRRKFIHSAVNLACRQLIARTG